MLSPSKVALISFLNVLLQTQGLGPWNESSYSYQIAFRVSGKNIVKLIVMLK